MSDLILGEIRFTPYANQNIQDLFNNLGFVKSDKTPTLLKNNNIPIGSCKILFAGESVIKIGGSSKTFTALFEDGFGNKITTMKPKWELDFSEYPELSGRVHIVEESESDIRIRAIGNDSLADKSFTLKLSAESEQGYFENRLEIKIDYLF